eukprot:Awhi_evm2s6479
MKVPDKIHLREQVALVEILNAAYIKLRTIVTPTLIAHGQKFDASALRWFFEHTLPLACLLYESIFKNGKGLLYKQGLAMLSFRLSCPALLKSACKLV